jgi:hypothetical protein
MLDLQRKGFYAKVEAVRDYTMSDQRGRARFLSQSLGSGRRRERTR